MTDPSNGKYLVEELFKTYRTNAYITNIAASIYFAFNSDSLIANERLFEETMNMLLGDKLGIEFENSLYKYREFRAGVVRAYMALYEEFDGYMRSKTKDRLEKDRLEIALTKTTLFTYFLGKRAKKPKELDEILDRNGRTINALMRKFEESSQQGGEGNEGKK